MFGFLTRPVRGIGRLLRGKFKEGLADVGSGVKTVGMGLSTINPLLGAGLVAAGSGMDKLDDPGGLKGTKLFKEIGLPAALTYGAGSLAKSSGIGRALSGGGPDVAASAIPNVNPVTASGAMNVAGNSAQRSLGSGIAKAIGGIGRTIAKNPKEALALAQVGLGAYGSAQEGAQQDRLIRMQEMQFEREQEEEERKRKQQEEVWRLIGPEISRYLSEWRAR